MLDYLRNLTKSAEEKQQETMNAYLDNALTPRQRQRFEQELANDEDLQTQLQQQQILKQQLRQLPQRPVPRNFMLDPAVHGRPERQPLIQLYPALRVATVLTAFLFILAAFAGIYQAQSGDRLTTAFSRDVAQMVEESGESAAEPAEVEVTRVVTEVIVESEVVETETVSEGEVVVVEEMAEEEQAVEAPVAEPATTTTRDEDTPEAAADELPSATMEGAAEIAAATPKAAATSKPSPTATPKPTATESVSPRLATETANTRSEAVGQAGDEAQQERDTMLSPTSQPDRVSQSTPGQSISNLGWLQIGLGVVVLLLALLTFYTRRQL